MNFYAYGYFIAICWLLTLVLNSISLVLLCKSIEINFNLPIHIVLINYLSFKFMLKSIFLKIIAQKNTKRTVFFVGMLQK
ncbi:MAG TPA: hypothetical protein DCQ31_16930 [Bacteroidales bacterium]|nr:hypothetical protein [Bacteroidales bacterium]